MKRLKLLLFNPKYSGGSLYGAGVFPFWVYIKFYGKPAYKFARKLGLNSYFSLMVANILGSLIHVHFFDDRTWLELLGFIVSMVVFPSLFYLNHTLYKKLRGV